MKSIALIAALAVLAASNGRDAARRRRAPHVTVRGEGANLSTLDAAGLACALTITAIPRVP